MHLEAILALAIGLWLALLLGVLAMCRAAKSHDDAMDAAYWIDQDLTRRSSRERPLRTLSPDDAATLLGVTPHTLLDWEARYGFPTSGRSDPSYNRSEVLALRESLADGLSISAAVIRARELRRAAAAARLHEHRSGELAS